MKSRSISRTVLPSAGFGYALVLLPAASLWATFPAGVATRTWTGGSGTSSYWSTTANWAGGVPFYVIERKTALTNSIWQPVTPPTRAMATNVPMDAPPAGFHRISGGN